MHKGRLIAIGFAVFAVVCGVVSLDYARGRVPETTSPLILDILSEGVAKQCRRGVSAVVKRHIQPGMDRAAALQVISGAVIALPRPWFWRASLTESLADTPDRLQATRTLRATAFGNELLLIDLRLKDGRVDSVAAKVECAFG